MMIKDAAAAAADGDDDYGGEGDTTGYIDITDCDFDATMLLLIMLIGMLMATMMLVVMVMVMMIETLMAMPMINHSGG